MSINYQKFMARRSNIKHLKILIFQLKRVNLLPLWGHQDPVKQPF